MTDPGFFSGDDRLEMCEALGRPMRMGSPDALAVGDVDRIAAMLAAGDFDSARQRLELFHGLGVGLTDTFLEWVVALPSFIEQQRPGVVDAIIANATELWRARVGGYDPRLVAVAAALLGALTPRSIDEFRRLRAAGAPTSAAPFLTGVLEAHRFVDQALGARDERGAQEAFRRYAARLRECHDMAGELVTSFGAAIMTHASQRESIGVMQQALESCALVGGMWDLIARLSPHALAAFLAEHLRGHFSGAERAGAVSIIEDEEKIRLVFDPCGSGGALRRARSSPLALCPEAAPDTWGRAGEVPTYCAHCARNELTSIEKLGYPAWVTEFDPDPGKACGWTVYKRREGIPATYWRRIGVHPR